ncbi:hypothetical protein [Nocardioides sp. SYSU D00065]|uniref:hypothetical protein n=1 Tax=Nocardioides sp. SYSU D00065 TaxID=2817378 RepID=UPI001B33F3E3|nr:hypothetical protein [Nocardioides sp. SYSU D00065]
MTVRPLHRRLLPLTGLLLATAVSVSACGSDESSGSESAAASSSESTDEALDGLDELADSGGVPEECREAFPAEVVPADIADVSGIPAEWPEPPVDATLCRTSSTMDDTLSIAGYATASSPAEVLDAYESALAEQWEVTREDNGMGEVLTGTAGDVWFQVETRDGAFDLSFAPA